LTKVLAAAKQSRFRSLLYLVYGAGLALALPPLNQIWICVLVLSLCAMTYQPSSSKRQAFWRGLCFGFGYFVVALHWIGFAFFVDAAETLWMMPFAVGGLALFLSLYWGLGFVIAHVFERWGFQHWLVLPVAIGVMEVLRGLLLTGFPWAAPGLIADGLGGVLQLASVVGQWGLTVLVLLWFSLPGVLWAAWKSQRASTLLPALLLITWPLGWWWGNNRLADAPPSQVTGPVIRLVQPNIAQSDKWRSENAGPIFNDLISLSTRTSGVLPDVVIWPESSLPFLLDESEEALARLGDVLQDRQVLLAGSIRRTKRADGEDYFTSIMAIDSNGKVFDVYDKWRLVPGGEFLPFASLLEPLGFRKVVALPEGFTAGPGARAIELPGIGTAAALICYEVIFPDRLTPAGQRPRVYVNVTNDGWFGQSVGPHQHLAQVRMRAVEQGIPFARAANTGISAVIDPLGRFVVQSELGVAAHLDAALPVPLANTAFAQFGGAGFAIVCLLLVVLAWLFKIKA
jgi:apolipoprotein N-acyltransferase